MNLPRPLITIEALFVLLSCASAGAPPPPRTNSSTDFPVTAWSPRIGVVIDSPVSYNPDRLFADAIKSARQFASYADLGKPVELDANGWPKGDASIVIWEGAAGLFAAGRYAFSCDGRVSGRNVTASTGSFSHWRYSPADRRSTADLTVHNDGNLVLFFKGIPGGVKNVRLIRPGTSASDEFSSDYLTRLLHFGVIRTLEFVAINNNPVRTWQQRTTPAYATQSGRTLGHRYGDPSDPPTGIAWEYFIKLCNRIGRDAWINIPHLADDDYITNLARLFRFGSDAEGRPYAKAQSAPVHPPLRSDLHLYVEWSNEVWNAAFSQSNDNNLAADVDYDTNDRHHYAFDKAGREDRNLRRWRRPAFEVVRVSDLFRSVYGDSAMMTTVRPVFAIWTASPWLTAMQLRYIDHVYGPENPYDHRGRHVNDIIAGIAGTTYTYLDDESGNRPITVDQYFAQLSSHLDQQTGPWLQQLSCMARKYGVEPMCYEGSQHTVVANDDRDNTDVQLAAQYDPRMKTFTSDMYRRWFQVGGGLHAYSGVTYAYSAHGQWGLGEWPDREDEPSGGPWRKRTTRESGDGGTPKWAAVKAVIGSGPIAPTVGKAVPTRLLPDDACARDDVGLDGADVVLAATSEEPSITYWFRTTSQHAVTLRTIIRGKPSLLQVALDGTPIRPDGGWGVGPAFVQTAALSPGLHGLRVSSRPGTGSVTFTPWTVDRL
jgi:hypothetical protein